MKKSSILILLILLFIVPVVAGQTGDTLQKKMPSSLTVYEYFIEEGLKDPIVEQIEKYDTAGNVIEAKRLDKLGEVKEWEKYAYDRNGNMTEEIVLDQKGEQEERTEWVYDGDLIIEKKYFDHKDRLYKRKEYRYEYH